MGGGNYNMNSSQFDFIKDENYDKKGGCFVTTPKAICYVIIALASMIIVAFVMYYYGPYSAVVKTIENPMDIEKLLNNSLENIPQDIRLPKDLEPISYKVKIDPKVNEENGIFEGEVTIRLKCNQKTKNIVLNADGLDVISVEAFKIDFMNQNRIKRDVLEENKNKSLSNLSSNSSINLSSSNSSLTISSNSSLNSSSNSLLNSPSNSLVNSSSNSLLNSSSNSLLNPSSNSLPNSSSNLSSNSSLNPPSKEETISELTTNVFSNDLNPTTELTLIINDGDDDNDKKSDFMEENISKINLNLSDHKYDSDSKYIIKLKKDLEKSKEYFINIKFKSNISEAFRGFYQSVFEDNTLFLATNLQPIYARKLFPCFDEPNYRASFQLALKNDYNQTMLSNTNLFRSYKDENGSIWEEFEITSSIPTYSFGFIIGDLIKLEEDDSFKPVIRIWGLNDYKDDFKDDVEIVVEFTKKILVYLEKYFTVGFPSDKIDLVFVKDLRSTTVSSGLIFLKDSLLFDLHSNKKLLFTELSKSLTKEWIGNLVSVSWWDDYWFINAFSVFILEDLQSSANFDSDFTLEVIQETLQSDDLKSALSLESKIENEVQIFDIIDKTKYNKGGCVLRMLNSSLENVTFQRGIQDFVKKWKNNSTDLEYLWKSFDLFTTKMNNLPENTNILNIIKTWTTQPSYPLITVNKNTKNNSIIINQSKFHPSNDSNDQIWIIPINYLIGNENIDEKPEQKTKEKTENFLWLKEKTQTIELNDLKTKWILFNSNYKGYYRVNYDLENWQMLIDTLKENYTEIPIENRAQLINDAFDLAEHSFLDYHIPFNLTRYLINETNYIPWISALKSLEFIRSILETTYLNGDYEDYIINLIGPIYDRISNENNQEKDKKLKDIIIETACSVNYPNCTKWALKILQNYIDGNNQTLNLSNRKIAFCTGIKLTGRKEWENLFTKLNKEDVQIEDLIYSLGCTKHPWLINKYLSATLNGTIPLKYVSNVWKSIKHVPSRSFGFKFLRENWEKIRQVYKGKRLILKTIIQDFLYSLSTRTDKEDLTLFFGKFEKDLQGFSYLLKGVVDRIDSRIAWKDKHLETIDKWLSLRQ